VLTAAVVVAAVVAYQWTQTRYFVGVNNDVVTIYRGVPEDVWVFSLSSVYEETDIAVDQLPPYQQGQGHPVLLGGIPRGGQRIH